MISFAIAARALPAREQTPFYIDRHAADAATLPPCYMPSLGRLFIFAADFRAHAITPPAAAAATPAFAPLSC
jgi:hypothetical protein